MTQYWFDDFGSRVATTSPDTGTTINLFNEAGNIIQKVDAKGTIINYTYDAANRPTSISFPADPAQNVTYTYDSTVVTNGIGRLTGRIDPSGSYVFYYDSQGNMNREDKTTSGVTYTTQYTYNKDNALTSITYPSGRVVTYSLNTAGRVSQVSTPIGGTNKALASSITHLPFGGVTAMTYGNNQVLTQVYDNQYRISSIMVDSLLYLTYDYDANGNITNILDAVNPPGNDPYDSSATYTYEQGSNVLTGIAGSSPVAYDTDVNGNIITENNRTYGYDLLNRLVTVSDSGTQTAAYTYNALNQRFKKVTSAGTKMFHYDTRGRLIAETTETGQTLVEYVYLNDQLLAQIRPTNQVYYYHNDHLGTPRVMTNSTGAVAWKALYAAFGAANVVISAVESNFRFPGQYYDAETDLHYNWNRYYDPKTGRYITADPIGLAGGINLFGYVGENPVVGYDTSGLAEACSRRWDFGPAAYAFPLRHCYMAFSDGSTLSYDTQGIHKDHVPGTWFKNCYKLEKNNENQCSKGCTEDCLRTEMRNNDEFSKPKHGYLFIDHNCCDSVRRAIVKCGCKFPVPIAMENWGW